MEQGVAGLLHDKTRPSLIPPLGAEIAERVIALTQQDRFEHAALEPLPGELGEQAFDRRTSRAANRVVVPLRL